MNKIPRRRNLGQRYLDYLSDDVIGLYLDRPEGSGPFIIEVICTPGGANTEVRERSQDMYSDLWLWQL